MQTTGQLSRWNTISWAGVGFFVIGGLSLFLWAGQNPGSLQFVLGLLLISASICYIIDDRIQRLHNDLTQEFARPGRS